jgi:hypothetical protein
MLVACRPFRNEVVPKLLEFGIGGIIEIHAGKNITVRDDLC